MALTMTKEEREAFMTDVHVAVISVAEDGDEETVKNFTLKDVQYYYDNYMTSQGVNVVVVGDIKEEEILPKLSFLKKLPNKKLDIPAIPAVKPVDMTKVYKVDVPKAAQTEFRVGYNTGLKYDATGEFYRTRLMNFALGGGFNGRLNINLREDKGWTYGARSAFTADKYSGEFEFSSGIKAGATDSALKEVMRELKDYATTGITEDEITFMKNSLGQRDALSYETGFQKAGFATPAELKTTETEVIELPDSEKQPETKMDVGSNG